MTDTFVEGDVNRKCSLFLSDTLHVFFDLKFFVRKEV